MDDVFLKKVINLNNWFTAHLCSAYAKADDATKTPNKSSPSEKEFKYIKYDL